MCLWGREGKEGKEKGREGEEKRREGRRKKGKERKRGKGRKVLEGKRRDWRDIDRAHDGSRHEFCALCILSLLILQQSNEVSIPHIRHGSQVSEG